MFVKELIISCATFALIHGSLDVAVTEHTVSNPQVTTIPSQLDDGVDTEDRTEYDLCIACLTHECTSLHTPLRYYMCEVCLKKCTKRTDVFMQFFSTRTCTASSHVVEKKTPQSPEGYNKTADENIINNFSSMFVTKPEYVKLSKQTWSQYPEEIANMSNIEKYENDMKVGNIPICQTRFKIVSPTRLLHRYGFVVELLQNDEFVQPFIVAECVSRHPTAFHNAVCGTVSVQRPAVMLVPKERSSSFEICYEYNSDQFVCKDWIKLPGACSLFL